MSGLPLRNAKPSQEPRRGVQEAEIAISGGILLKIWNRLVAYVLGPAMRLPELMRDRQPGTISPYEAFDPSRQTRMALTVIEGGLAKDAPTTPSRGAHGLRIIAKE
jgi:hypothetical protein